MDGKSVGVSEQGTGPAAAMQEPADAPAAPTASAGSLHCQASWRVGRGGLTSVRPVSLLVPPIPPERRLPPAIGLRTRTDRSRPAAHPSASSLLFHTHLQVPGCGKDLAALATFYRRVRICGERRRRHCARACRL